MMNFTKKKQPSVFAETADPDTGPLVLEWDVCNPDMERMHEAVHYWAGRAGLVGRAEERFLPALDAIIESVSANSSGGGGFSVRFMPYSHCLEVSLEFDAGAADWKASLLGDPELSAAVMDNVDKAVRREENGRVALILTQYARDPDRPGELYFLNFRPKINEQVDLTFSEDGSGLAVQSKTKNVLRLSAMGGFAVRAMDGRTAMRDIYRAMVEEFGLVNPRRLGVLVEQLYMARMVTLGRSLAEDASPRTLMQRIRSRLSLDFPVRQGAERMRRLCRVFGGLYCRRALWVWSVFSLVSLIIFNFNLDDHDHVFESPMQILDNLEVWGVVLFYLAAGLLTAVHELSHGLTCVRNGGVVSSFGFMLYYASIAAYCDTTDAWRFTDKWRRIAVSFAGPMSNIVLGCLLAWGDLGLDRAGYFGASDFCGALAMLSMFMAAVNLMPVLELDGYYMLSDFAGIPRLKHEAHVFIRHVFFKGEASGKKYSGFQRLVLAGYGVLSPLFAMALLGLVALKLALDPYYQDHRFWFWFGFFLLSATAAQRIAAACRWWYASNRIKEVVIK